MTARVFLSEGIDWTTPGNEQLVDDFKKYVIDKKLPTSFGRDAPLNRPKDALFAGLFHLHLGDFNRHTFQYHRTSDDWLIYAKGLYDSNMYLLIDVLSPDAHKQSNNIDLVKSYIAIADKFRDTF
ncbi:hypothetical protein AL536_13600 [Vibrio fluvialis]|uniref:mRNA interferase YafO n=1 Tax=Vibrio fluvialis TaxID=676 RepID=A0AAX2LQN9_VIBFL|nr:type II toxin-antitoxin system YafO family toxin [Vibrio fluvialis]AMF94500.1 hypothetical protein AL536_13600 [Vibrio fluvialis]EKO4008307.1 hypothetical protein [Vibrio fluvialis]MBY8227448.1 type II toxin-antitoxin system YafO family toxin [Vibrio fluvialis]MCE7633010.1 type II toxin-antitoxin system YafO family toxin [Vibrio fluvialis]SUP24454.1 mRNA interferase YafO [Vibrio fluvialis]